MKRFVTYVFTYDNGVKDRNVGFIKTDIRQDGCRMEIHIQNPNRIQGKGTVYLLMKKEELIGVPLGDITFHQGRGELRNVFSKDCTYAIGVAICCTNKEYMASSWSDTTDEEIARGDFLIWNEGQQKKEQPIIEETEQKKAVAAEEVKQIETSENIRRIDFDDIKQLPKRNWYLCNNSFLQHGFSNYHYLVIKKEEKEGKINHFLGVPGIYEKPERIMAMLFGFSDFAFEDKEKGFGYWLCPLDM